MSKSMTRSRRRLLALLMLGLTSSCSSWPSDSSSEPGPIEIAGREAKTIVLLPLNIVLALPTELAPSREMVSKALVEHVEGQGKTVYLLDVSAARALWIQATKIVSESNRAKNFENAAEVLTQLIGEKVDFDALIIPSLYLQNAKLKQTQAGIDAHWSGATQRVEWIGTPSTETEDPKLGSLRAATILVSIFDRAGRELVEKRTGLELIEHLAIEVEKRQGRDKRTWVVTSDLPPIDDEVRLEAAIAFALHPFLPQDPAVTSRLSQTRAAG
jgi:hypothetical protein